MYIYILLQCKDGSLINEMFMTVIKSTDSIDELVSVIEQLDCDIAKWRSKDTGGTDGELSPGPAVWSRQCLAAPNALSPQLIDLMFL